MATLSTANPTLLDLAKMQDPGGRLQVIAEVLTKVNNILDTMPWIEGNLQTGHRAVVRTSLPTVSWRALNEGVLPTKSTNKQVTDVCGLLEAYTEVDAELARMSGDINGFRMREDAAHIEAMSQEMASTLIYGSANDAKEFVGLKERYDALSNSQVLGAGGTGADQTSMWLITWDERCVTGIYPKNTRMGLEYENIGLETVTKSDGSLLRAYRSHYIWRAGLHIADEQSVVRLCNLDAGTLYGGAASGLPDLPDLMVRAYAKIPSRLEKRGKKAWYCNKDTHTALIRKAMDKTVVNTITLRDIGNGIMMPYFWDIPIYRCDAILNTEAQVS